MDAQPTGPTSPPHSAAGALRLQHIVFLQRLIAERPQHRRAQGVAGHLAKSHGVGTSSQGMVSYTPNDLEAARLLLERSGRPPRRDHSIPFPAP
jgi:hypothetical protein